MGGYYILIPVPPPPTDNNTMTFAEKMKLKEEKEEIEASISGEEILIPKTLVLVDSPSIESQETVAFERQPKLVMHDAVGRWVKVLGTKLLPPWSLQVTLKGKSMDTF